VLAARLARTKKKPAMQQAGFLCFSGRITSSRRPWVLRGPERRASSQPEQMLPPERAPAQVPEREQVRVQERAPVSERVRAFRRKR
jgi:hypothetical protein